MWLVVGTVMWKPFQVSLCLSVSLRPVSLPTPSSPSSSHLLRTPLPSRSFLLFLWMQGIRHFCLWTLGARARSSFAFWSMMLLGPRSVLTLTITTRMRVCTHPLHDFLSLTHTLSERRYWSCPGAFSDAKVHFQSTLVALARN